MCCGEEDLAESLCTVRERLLASVQDVVMLKNATMVQTLKNFYADMSAPRTEIDETMYLGTQKIGNGTYIEFPIRGLMSSPDIEYWLGG